MLKKKKSREFEVYGSGIFIVLFVSIALLVSDVTLMNFFIYLVLSVLILAVFNLLRVKKSVSPRKKHRKPDSATMEHEEIDLQSFSFEEKESRLIKLKKSNFNWSGEDVCRIDSNKKEDKLDKKNKLNTSAQEIEFNAVKMVPYRSPFDPINPPAKKEERADASEAVSMDNCNDMVLPVSILDEIKAHDQTAALSDTKFALADNESVDNNDELVSKNNDGDANYEAKVVKLPFRHKMPADHFTAGIQHMSEKVNDNSEYKEHLKPPFEMLNKQEDEHPNDGQADEAEENSLDATAQKLINTLASFGVGAKILNISQGPSVTRYELQPNAGVKVSKIVNLSDDIALNLAATGVRIEAPIPGKAAVGIEVPNKEVQPVLLRDVIETEEFQKHPSKLAFAVGKDVSGRTIVGDIARMPHLLIAGATGSGKSVCINTLIASILFKATPDDVKLLMVDPKVVELGIYNGIPHLLIPVVTDPKKAAGALSWAVVEMTTRYKLFADNNVRDLKGYNALVKEREEGSVLPQIVIIIDELADLMMVAPNEVEDCICRLAQMARAAGMHLVIATQRPSVDVITGVIKANVPSRISFAVSSQIDSRTILDMAGAEKLLGRGDMLFNPIGEPKPIRVQGGFISDKEVETIVSHLKATSSAEYDQEILDKINSQTEPQQLDANCDDELLPQAIDMVLDAGQASTSLIQRKFKVGYSRAARIMDQMEAWGVVGKQESSKPRQILITKQEWEEVNS